MSREPIRRMKKALCAGTGARAAAEQRQLAGQAALALLERSVRMRHRRLAVQRLSQAVALGARVPEAHWCYCRDAAAASRDTAMHLLFAVSERAAHGASPAVAGELRHG